jgi:hypothetical protein
MLRKYGIARAPKLIMRLPFTKNQNTGQIRIALHAFLALLKLPQEIKDHLEQNFRLVNTRRDSIADILHNHIPFSKLFSKDNIQKCVCPNSSDRENEHKIRLSDSFSGDAFLVLSQNSKNIPHPDYFNTADEVKSGFRNIIADVSKLLSQSEQNHSDFHDSGFYNHFSTNVVSFFDKNDPMLHEVFSSLRRASEIRSISKASYPRALSLSVIKEVKKSLSGCIFLGLDQNVGKTAVVCPVKMQKILENVFINDEKHYEQLHQKPAETILRDLKNSFHENHWSSVSNLRYLSSLPYGYAIPKAKDLDRLRPIISYVRHPLKNVFRVTQRALMFIIRNMKVSHFTLNRTQDLLERFSNFQQDLDSVFGEQTLFLPFSMDIKEMFTDLLHSAIRDSILFVIDQANDLTRSKFVRVPRDKSLQCSFGKSSNRFETNHVSFAQIFQIVDFDITNARFTVGKHIFHQVNGVPIGGVLSTAAAIATCAAAEHRWLSSLGADARFLRAVRYVDDVSGVVAYRENDQQTLNLAHSLLDSLKNDCYPGGLLLKDENIESGSFKFLETITTISKNQIHATFNNKNIDSICSSGTQKFYTLQSSYSYSKRSAKLGVIIARLHAMDRNTATSSDLFKAVGLFFIELRLKGYGTKIMKQACARMQTHTGGTIWPLISKFLISCSSVG